MARERRGRATNPKQRYHAPAGDGANLGMRDAVDLAVAIISPEDWRTGVRA